MGNALTLIHQKDVIRRRRINLPEADKSAALPSIAPPCGVVKKVYGLRYTAYGLDKP